ncbi:phBC6A51 family helix-turn-helix protein [Geomicrobium sediminis]|uniref:Transposase-like protein n=1 Tax=Geomicrobium sediminis TaxID=1347788 RepID=A0ABS2P753_9BACL|nr:phBC6A51 family helix-turn-helix protein [Geomicrobium sediminis]MBM7631112.1 transposase-like protein [Geomicrobium sediminis]
MLNEPMMRAVELIAEGQLNKSEIASRVGISRPTLYKWLDNEEFKAEVHSRLHKERVFAEKMIEARLEFAINKLHEIAKDSSNRRVQAQTLQYLVDRALGKPTTRVDLDQVTSTAQGVEGDVLDAELDKWSKDE